MIACEQLWVAQKLRHGGRDAGRQTVMLAFCKRFARETHREPSGHRRLDRRALAKAPREGAQLRIVEPIWPTEHRAEAAPLRFGIDADHKKTVLGPVYVGEWRPI